MLPISSRGRNAKIVIALAAMIVAGIAACTSRIADGVSGPKPTVATRSANTPADQPYFEFQVSKAVRQVPGTGNMHYPDMLRAANVSGVVLAQFVVDESGTVMPGTFKVLKSDHDLFTQAVRNALPSMSFYAAEVKGAKVKQLVQQPFTFSLESSGSGAGSASVHAGEPIRPEPPASMSRAPVAQGTTTGTPTTVGKDQVLLEYQVEKQARQLPGTGNLRYPDKLRASRVEGQVLAQFVVDADGSYEAGSFKVLKSSDDLFSQAVATALPNMRFSPALVGGKAVRQMLQQGFIFSLAQQ